MIDTTRRGFLSALGNAPLAASVVKSAASSAPQRTVRLLDDVPVAGTAYYDAKTMLGALTVGGSLKLRREPTNPHDHRAIEVFARARAPLNEWNKLGYVPRTQNEAVAALMDASVPVRGTLRAVRWQNIGYNERTRGVWCDLRFAVEAVL